MKLLVSAFEHSANIHLKSVKEELSDTVEFIGIFDKELGKPIVDLRSLAVMGFIDVIKKLRFFLKLNKQMVKLAKDVDKVLLIDSSGFNLPLAKKIKKKYPDKEIIYYILPQAWAWKKKRIPVLAKTIDKLASILPFEKEYYPDNAPISYVGHPLLDQITEFKTQLTDEVKTIAFMPGSRKAEIQSLMPIYREVAKKIAVKSLLIVPKYFQEDEIDALYGDLSNFEVVHDAHKVLKDVDFAFICSGTATLEAALIGTPFILSYIAKPLDYFIASRLVQIEYVGLANIMFTRYNGTELHPEFLQEAVSVDNLMDAYEHYDKANFLHNSQSLREYLQHGSAQNVARMIEERVSNDN